ncbi:MAG: hypothetical protein ACJ76F_09680 [Bacteroidia bacterium]
MRTKKLTLVFLLALGACGSEQTKEKKQTDADKESVKASLQGSWFGKEYEEHAVFSIQGDSISYVEHPGKYVFSIYWDTLDIIAPEGHIKQIILKSTKDSLLLKDAGNGEVMKYWK